jgi:hypothetical protein
MILLAGTAIRFKGNHSARMAEEFAESLRGHCSRGGSKIVITKTTQVRVKMFPNGSSPIPDPTPTRNPILDLSELRSNGE